MSDAEKKTELPECCTAPDTATLQHMLYAVYNATAEPKGLNYQGLPCPEWEKLPNNIRQKWQGVAMEATRLMMSMLYGQVYKEPAPLPDFARCVLINVTPHPLHIMDSNGTVQVIPRPDGCAEARVETFREPPIGGPRGIDIHRTRFGAVVDLPPQRDGILHIVSLVVASHPDCRGRTDLLSPGIQVRDADGNITHAKGLSSNVYGDPPVI